MQQFQTYPLSSIPVLRKDGIFHVVDDNNNSNSSPHLTSNDSGISIDNESILSDEYEFDIDQTNNSFQSINITEDGIQIIYFKNIISIICFSF
jgi:hypothetical protein